MLKRIKLDYLRLLKQVLIITFSVHPKPSLKWRIVEFSILQSWFLCSKLLKHVFAFSGYLSLSHVTRYWAKK